MRPAKSEAVGRLEVSDAQDDLSKANAERVEVIYTSEVDMQRRLQCRIKALEQRLRETLGETNAPAKDVLPAWLIAEWEKRGLPAGTDLRSWLKANCASQPCASDLKALTGTAFSIAG